MVSWGTVLGCAGFFGWLGYAISLVLSILVQFEPTNQTMAILLGMSAFSGALVGYAEKIEVHDK